MLTKSNTSVPNLDTHINFSYSILGTRERQTKYNTGLYQTMVSNDESSNGYEDYIIAEDNGLGMDNVTPPKQSQSSVKHRGICSNVYDYFELSVQLTPNLAPGLTLDFFLYRIHLEIE
ncbi:hypothetical protein O181_003208 [Austropuccinia psidii MF-1]|uniref:Uncharacterized protein n=1 Tax=Austropuccinia psidii MF-1 TaxID=1389203 RepID=A0A9Q3GDC2_9BASI|nr:hypothetical protein [Austropuccinia psidii MF-1]